VIVDVPAEIGAGYLQSASQASSPSASLLGHRKFGCDNCVINLTNDKFSLGWLADKPSMGLPSLASVDILPVKVKVFLSFHHAEQCRATFCCKRAI